MTLKTEQQLIVLASHFDLQIEYVNDLPDSVPGFLQPGPEPCYIIINANKTRSDHAFTIAHELAHYVLHLNRPALRLIPWYVNHQCQSKQLIQSSQETKDFNQQKFGCEWQADFWAFILLWHIGAIRDLIAITWIYPRMKWMFCYSFATVVCGSFKRRTKNLLQNLSDLFNPQPPPAGQ